MSESPKPPGLAWRVIISALLMVALSTFLGIYNTWFAPNVEASIAAQQLESTAAYVATRSLGSNIVPTIAVVSTLLAGLLVWFGYAKNAFKNMSA